MNYTKRGTKLSNLEYDRKLIQTDFERIDEYVNAKTPILHKCKICEKNYKIKPKELKKNNCKCKTRSEVYKNKIKNKEIILLSTYKNSREKILHKCLKCNFEFLSTPKSVSSSKWGCPSCSGKKFSHEKYISLLPKNIEIKETYKDSASYLLHVCTICNWEWFTKPNYIIHMGCGCPKCASSKGESKISELLQNHNIKFIKEKTIKINDKNLRFDFHLEELDIFIEFDGIQHFVEREFFGGQEYLKKVKRNDKEKTNWCKQNKKKLLRITYQQLDEIDEFLIQELKKLNLNINI